MNYLRTTVHRDHRAKYCHIKQHFPVLPITVAYFNTAPTMLYKKVTDKVKMSVLEHSIRLSNLTNFSDRDMC